MMMMRRIRMRIRMMMMIMTMMMAYDGDDYKTWKILPYASIIQEGKPAWHS